MEELMYKKSFDEYKQEVANELQKSAEGFVRIGFLLKVARDTDILTGRYDSVNEFAQKEFGLDKTQVSRFIHINDRFSEGGNSDVLMEQYRGYGYAKLTLMLQLPDALNEELTPEYTKSEIQSLKEAKDEESKISDIEVLLEEKTEGTLLTRAVYELLKGQPDIYKELYEVGTILPSAVVDIIAPSGSAQICVRIPGDGGNVLSINANMDSVTRTNLRNGDKEYYSVGDLVEAVKTFMRFDMSLEEGFETEFCIPFPVQETRSNERIRDEPKKDKKTEQKKSKVIKPKPAPKVETKPEEETIEENEDITEHADQYLEGQQEITDYPEVMPEVAPVQPEKVQGEVEEVTIMTRKQWLDAKSEYGVALYIQAWYFANAEAKAIMCDVTKLTKWLEERVDMVGRTIS